MTATITSHHWHFHPTIQLWPFFRSKVLQEQNEGSVSLHIKPVQTHRSVLVQRPSDRFLISVVADRVDFQTKSRVTFIVKGFNLLWAHFLLANSKKPMKDRWSILTQLVDTHSVMETGQCAICSFTQEQSTIYFMQLNCTERYIYIKCTAPDRES